MAKPAPKKRYYAQIDPVTGNVIGYASGTNIDIRNSNEWRDITDIRGAKQLTGKAGKAIFRDGVFKKKPKLRLDIAGKRVEVGSDIKVTLSLVEGDPTLVPEEIGIKIGATQYAVKLGQEIKIKSTDARKINIRVNDPLVALDDRVAAVRVVPVGTPIPTKPAEPEVDIGKVRGQSESQPNSKRPGQ